MLTVIRWKCSHVGSIMPNRQEENRRWNLSAAIRDEWTDILSDVYILTNVLSEMDHIMTCYQNVLTDVLMYYLDRQTDIPGVTWAWGAAPGGPGSPGWGDGGADKSGTSVPANHQGGVYWEEERGGAIEKEERGREIAKEVEEEERGKERSRRQTERGE